MDRQITRRDLLSGAAMGAGLAILGNTAAGQNVGALREIADTVGPLTAQLVDTIRVGLVRATPVVGGYAANWTTFSSYATTAKNTNGCHLCISPECFVDGCVGSQSSWSRAQVMAAGDTCRTTYLPLAQTLAANLNMMLLVGMTYTVSPMCWNSAFLIGSNGSIIGRYDKTHLMDYQVTRLDAGTDLPVFATPYGLMGIMIGTDRLFPETARVLRVREARLILNPDNGTFGADHEKWMRTRAYENECHICYAHPTVSAVFDLPGTSPALYYQSGAAGLTWGDVNLATTAQVNHVMFNARRPELYGPMAV